MQPEDRRFLEHMLDYAREARDLAAGMTREEYDADRLARHGLTRISQIVGEAAWRVSTEFKRAHPEIPWKQIEGFRHKVVHDYFSVDYALVWDVSTVHVTALIDQLERILGDPAN